MLLRGRFHKTLPNLGLVLSNAIRDRTSPKLRRVTHPNFRLVLSLCEIGPWHGIFHIITIPQYIKADLRIDLKY